jgi:hypothetical protein
MATLVENLFLVLRLQLTHGVAIQWDGRIIRHCTSMVEPGVGNHVYGTFCAAKAKVVDFGRKLFEEDRLRQKYLSHVFDGDEQADASSDDDDEDQEGSPPVSGDIQSVDPLANMKVPRRLDAATSANSVDNRESKQTILGTGVELMGPVIISRVSHNLVDVNVNVICAVGVIPWEAGGASLRLLGQSGLRVPHSSVGPVGGGRIILVGVPL